MHRRQLLAGGLGAGAGLIGASSAMAAAAPNSAEADRARIERETRRPTAVPHRRARTVNLFQSPGKFPNGMDVAPEGFWVAEQLTVEGVGSNNDVNLLDMNGRVLRNVKTQSVNTSGLAFGGGYLWVGANGDPQGIYQTDTNSRLINRRPTPLGPAGPSYGGGNHGVCYADGKVYLTANRLRGILRVDARTWQPEMLIPWTFPRTHDLAWDNGSIWMVIGTGEGGLTPGLAKYDAASGRLLETVEFVPGSADPHGLTCRNGVLYSCDAGIHPGKEVGWSPGSGYIFRIDFV